MKTNNTKRLLADQKFKISESNKDIRDYLEDNDFNCRVGNIKKATPRSGD